MIFKPCPCDSPKVHVEAELCVELYPPATLVLTWRLNVSRSPPLFTASLSAPVDYFLCFLSADARCGKGRRRAEVYWGDVGRGAQSDTHRATDPHGRRQSLHISVELIMRVHASVCVCFNLKLVSFYSLYCFQFGQITKLLLGTLTSKRPPPLFLT